MFASSGTNLDASDHDAKPDIFMRDRACVSSPSAACATTRVSTDGLSVSGVSLPAMSRDGRYVAFMTMSPLTIVFRDRLSGSPPVIVSDPAGAAFDPLVSSDGRNVLYSDYVLRIVAADPRTGARDGVDPVDGSGLPLDRAKSGGAIGTLDSMSSDARFVTLRYDDGAVRLDRLTHASEHINRLPERATTSSSRRCRRMAA